MSTCRPESKCRPLRRESSPKPHTRSFTRVDLTRDRENTEEILDRESRDRWRKYRRFDPSMGKLYGRDFLASRCTLPDVHAWNSDVTISCGKRIEDRESKIATRSPIIDPSILDAAIVFECIQYDRGREIGARWEKDSDDAGLSPARQPHDR